MATEWILVQTITFILSSPQPGTLSCQCLDSGKTEANPLGSLSATPQVKMLDVGFSFLFPSQGRSQESWNFPSDHHALMWLVSCSPGVEEPLDMFSDFSQGNWFMYC